jgi:hypothetical protein
MQQGSKRCGLEPRQDGQRSDDREPKKRSRFRMGALGAVWTATLDAQQQRGSVWRDEGSGLWVVGVGVGMRVRVGVEQTDKMLRAIPTWRLLGRRGRQPRRSDASTRCGPKTLNASLSPRGASSASRLISRCTALHCMIESWRTAGRDTHIATIQSGRAAVQHHTRRADGGLDLCSTHGCHASGA